MKITLLIAVTLPMLCAAPAYSLVSTNRTVSPATDIGMLQRLSVLDYDSATGELRDLPPEPFIQYVMALGQIWDRKQNPSLTRAYFDLALEKARTAEMKETEARILYFYALHDNSSARLVAGINHISAAVGILDKTGPRDQLKECLSLKANLEHQRGAYPDAIATNEKLVALATGKDDDLLKANALQEIALLRFKMGRSEGVEAYAREAMEIFEQRKHDEGIADCFKLLGNLAGGRGGEEEAVGFYQRAAEKYKAAQNIHGQANCLYNMGLSLRRMKQYEQSLNSFQDAIAAYTRSSSVTGVGIATMQMGNTHLAMRDFAKAEAALLLAQSLLTKSDCVARLAETENYLARLRVAQVRMQEAVVHCKNAIKLYESVKMTSEAGEVRALLDSIARLK